MAKAQGLNSEQIAWTGHIHPPNEKDKLNFHKFIFIIHNLIDKKLHLSEAINTLNSYRIHQLSYIMVT